jgi:hypothetical protein
MNRNIFINCPFDEDYSNIFDSILFAIYFCGCKPRCAMEIDDGSQIRLDKIYDIIEDSDLGIHDISRTQLNINELPRFNMPFEFGIFMAACEDHQLTKRKPGIEPASLILIPDIHDLIRNGQLIGNLTS